VGKPRGNRPLGRPIHKWEDNIKMDIREIGRGGVDLSGSGFGPVAGCCERNNEPSGSIKFWEVLRVAERRQASQERLSFTELV
jgi:hypothetical protein